MSGNIGGGGNGGGGGGGALEGLGGPIAMDPYTIGGIDPCLDACCQREIEDNRRYNALQSTLRKHDIIAQRERRRRNLVKLPTPKGGEKFDEGCRCCYDPNSDGGEYRSLIDYKLEHYHQQQQQQQQSNENNNNNENDDPAISVDDYFGKSNNTKDYDDDEDSDDEFDYLLDEDFGTTKTEGGENNINEISTLEEQRRLELEMQILTKQVALQHGYGIHRQIHPQRVLKVAGLSSSTSINNNNGRRSSEAVVTTPPPPAVVLHLVDPDSVSSASLDYLLETNLANKYPGTIFLRSGGRSTLLLDNELAKRALPHFKESMLPAIICIKDGIAINQCPNLCGLTNYDGEIDEYAVEHWLAMSGVLIKQSPRYIEELCNIRPEEEALMDYLATTTTSKQPPPTTSGVVDEEQRYDCGLESCCKTYPHEHVGIQTTEQSGLVVKEETILDEE